ncbi:MAG: sensor histidine kinase [Candidatus Dormibacteria bacterium]
MRRSGSGDVALSSPPFSIDFRIATSAVEGLRFLLATRRADIRELVGRLETMEVHVSARRARVRSQLRRNEAARQQLLASLTTSSPHEVERVFTEGIHLCGELGALDERVGSIEGRMKALETETGILMELSDRLLEASELRGANLNEDTARFNRAIRGLSQLIDDDNAAVAREVLEGPVQQLADLSVRLEVVERLMARRLPGAAKEFSACLGAARAAQEAFERMIFAIRPGMLDDVGLARTLRELARRIPSPVACRFELIGDERWRLRPSLEVAILRLVQEAVRNAIRHGHAQEIDVVLSLHGDRAVVMVRDDGEGFDVVATEARLGKTGALGLITMRERVEVEGGILKVRSAPGAGTEVGATFDLRAQRAMPSPG